LTAPYREPAPVDRDSGTPPRYVPISRRRERLVRWLRSVPVVLFAFAALYFERPWLLGAAIVWGVGSVVVNRLHARSLNARLKALAGTLARDGDPGVAMRGLESIVADASGFPSFHSVALLFLGIARARSGDLDGALELLYVVHHGGWLDRRDVWQAWLLPWLSQLHTARGELDLGERWLEAARLRLGNAEAGGPDRRDSLASAETLLALRRGENGRAIACIDGSAGKPGANDPQRAQGALFRAFALDRAGRPLPDDETRRIVATYVASVRPLPLEKWWAELAAFLDKHAPAATA
jgi:hypothetical protein